MLICEKLSVLPLGHVEQRLLLHCLMSPQPTSEATCSSDRQLSCTLPASHLPPALPLCLATQGLSLVPPKLAQACTGSTKELETQCPAH